MLLERAYLLARDGVADDLAVTMYATGVPLLKSVAGAKNVRFGPSVESPGTFMLLVEWDDMDAHIAFTKDPSFGVFRALLAPFTKGGSMEFFNMR